MRQYNTALYDGANEYNTALYSKPIEEHDMSKREANREYRAEKSRLDKLSRSQQRRGMHDANNKAYQHQNARVNDAARKASWLFK